MRTAALTLAIVAAVGLAGCSRRAEQRQDSAARQAGRQAHEAAQAVNRGAQQAAQQLRQTGKAFQQGWNEAGPPRQQPPPPGRNQGPQK